MSGLVLTKCSALFVDLISACVRWMVSTACGKHYNMRSRASETAEDSEAQLSQTRGGGGEEDCRDG